MLDAEMRQETEEIVRLHGEFLRRLGHGGTTGVAELVERFEQVRRAAGTISCEEIDAALVRIEAVVDRLRGVAAQFQELSEMRSALGVTLTAAQEVQPPEPLD